MQISVKESNRLGAPSTVAVSERPADAYKKTLLSGIIGSSGLSAALQEMLHNNSSNYILPIITTININSSMACVGELYGAGPVVGRLNFALISLRVEY